MTGFGPTPFIVSPATQRRVTELTFAISPNAPRYRTITRYLLEAHERLRDRIAPEEIHDAVAPWQDDTYPVELLQQDLRALVEWGNLATEQDRSKARSVEEFHRTRLVYRLTPTGLEIERMLLALEQARVEGGTLNATLLERIWTALDRISIALAAGVQKRPDVEQLRHEIAAPWDTIVTALRELQNGARDFHQTLSTAMPADAANPQAFLIYKDTIRDHLAGFLQELQDYAHRIHHRFERWTRTHQDRLLTGWLAEHDVRAGVVRLDLRGQPMTQAEMQQLMHGPAFTSVAQWFAPEGGADILMQKTKDAILFIVAQNERLVARHAVGSSRRRDLERLAATFAHLDMVRAPNEVAHRLWARSLGTVVPRHLRGGADNSTLMTPAEPVWSQPASAYPLRIVRRGIQRLGSTATVTDRSAELAAARAEAKRAIAYERALWDRLLTDGVLETQRLVLEDPQLRAPLLDLIARARLDADGIAVTRDGRTIRLVPIVAAEQVTPLATQAAPGTEENETLGRIVAPDGTFLMPRIQLEAIEDGIERLPVRRRNERGTPHARVRP